MYQGFVSWTCCGHFAECCGLIVDSVVDYGNVA